MSIEANKKETNPVIPAAVFNRVSKSIMEHVNGEVLGIGLYGSRLRGYADISADYDFAVIQRLPNKDYFNINPTPIDTEKKRRMDELEHLESERINRLVFADTGVRIAMSLIDERRAIMGVMQGNPNIAGAVHSAAENSEYVRDNILPLYDQYLSLGTACSRQLEVANYQISRLHLAGAAQIYRQERNFLTSMWCILRALEFVSDYNDNTKVIYNTQMSELITNACSTYSEVCPILKDPDLFTPFYRRVNRQRFDQLTPIDISEVHLLEELYSQVTNYISTIDFDDYRDKASSEDVASELLKMFIRNDEHFSAKAK